MATIERPLAIEIECFDSDEDDADAEKMDKAIRSMADNWSYKARTIKRSDSSWIQHLIKIYLQNASSLRETSSFDGISLY